MRAAQGGHLEVAQLLLERGAHPNAATIVSLHLLAIFAVKCSMLRLEAQRAGCFLS